jgi:hypothetical protein
VQFPLNWKALKILIFLRGNSKITCCGALSILFKSFSTNGGLMTSLLIVLCFAIFNTVFTCFILLMFCFWSYASFIFIVMYLITVVILSLYITVNFLCDFDMRCIRCYLPTCPTVFTTAMDVNKVESWSWTFVNITKHKVLF